MSEYSPLEGAPLQDPYEVLPARSGVGGWVLALVHMAIGGMAMALAVDQRFASGKATFAADIWRVVLGTIGGILLYQSAKAVARSLNADRPRLTPDLFERARRKGAVVLVFGLALMVFSVLEPVAEESISFGSWARWFFLTGGAYLALLGLTFQRNPTRTIRMMRLRGGQGLRGKAQILRFSDAGRSVDDTPRLLIDFEITVDDRVHRASDTIAVGPVKEALVVPGATVDVLVDPVDPTVFHIYWDRWTPPQDS